MGFEGDEDGFDKSGLGGKLAFAASFSVAVALAILIFFHCHAKRLRRLQERRQRVASLYQITTQSHNSGTNAVATPLGLLNFGQPQPPPKSGLDPLVIASLPEFVYKPKPKPEADQNGQDHDGDDDQVIDCAVCLSNIEEETTVRMLLNCKHVFHVECIDMWLGSNTTCPVCRAAVEPCKVRDLQEADHGGGPESSSVAAQVDFQATAPPMSAAMEDEVGTGTQRSGDMDDKASGSGSRLSSFRRMLIRTDRSSREAAAEDLERQ